MSKKKSSKKRTPKAESATPQAAKTTAKAATPRTREPKRTSEALTFSRQTYIWMAAGVGLMALGMILMLGGKQAPTEWNPAEIYSFRRTVLSPLVILAGLGVVWYAIAKK
jgi:hypothetical protein